MFNRGKWRSAWLREIVTYLTIIACVLAVRRFGPGPLSLVLGVGLVTPLRWLGAIGLTCLLLGYWFLVTAIPRGRRMRVVVPTLVGSVAVGGPLWVLWLGPLLLP